MPNNSVAFYIFGLPIYYYGIIICAAILLCVIFAVVLCKLKKIDTNMPFEIFLAIIPAGLLCARLFSVLFEPDLTISEYFNFRTGGLSIIGAIIGGAVGLFIYSLIRRKNFLMVADILTSVLLLGQSIGRWGNFFNQEVYGQLVTNPSLRFFPLAVNVGGQWFEALFFYESILSLIGFIILVVVYLKSKQVGLVTGLYFVYYGTVRLILEPRRQAEYILKLGSVKMSMLMSALFVAVGVGILAFVIYKKIKEKKVGRKEIHQA